MDKQSSEIIENFINFLKGKKEVIQCYEEKYSKSGREEVTVKRYEWDDIISESNDIISQSIQAIKSLQMENENLRETIVSFQSLQQSSNLKQSVFTFEEKNKHNNDYNIEDHLENYDKHNNFDDQELNRLNRLDVNDINKTTQEKSIILTISKENDMLIANSSSQRVNRSTSKDLLEEEEEILPYTPYQPLKNNVASSGNYNLYEYNIKENSNYDIYDVTKYNKDVNYLIDNSNHNTSSPSFSRASRKIEAKEQSNRDKQNIDMKDNILIVDSYNVNKIEGNNDNKEVIFKENQMKNIDDDNVHYQEEFYKNFENTNTSINLNKSPLKVGIRQKLKSFANKDSNNTSRIKSDNQTINYNMNSRSQTLNLSNVYNNQERGKIYYNFKITK